MSIFGVSQLMLAIGALLVTSTCKSPQKPSASNALNADAANAGSGSEMHFYAIDVGTGLSLFFEIPRPGQRPARVLYDAGESTDEVAKFLASPPVSLKTASGENQGDVIDYLILSHPHRDHYFGAKKVLKNFDVRHIIESKQILSQQYLQQFKVPAIEEIVSATKRGEEAAYYVVALPYPRGFESSPEFHINEYDLCQKNLPEHMKILTCRTASAPKFPFSLNVAQDIAIPMDKFAGAAEVAGESKMPVKVIPIGTRVNLAENAYFTILNGDSIAAFRPEIAEGEPGSDKVYNEAKDYFKGVDFNDSSVAIQVVHGASRFFLPGDSHGRAAKPDFTVSIEEAFGENAYKKEQVKDRLNLSFGSVPQEWENYILGGTEMVKKIRSSFVSYDRVTPVEMKVKIAGKERSFTGTDEAASAMLSSQVA